MKSYMKIFFILSACFYFTLIHSQTQTVDSTTVNKSDDVFTIVEQYPTFPGGDEAWFNFLNDNMTYPALAKKQGIQGKVWVSFIVDKEGNVSNVKVARGIGGGCDEEAIRVVSMSPKWNPAMQSGRPVSVKYNFPINFALR